MPTVKKANAEILEQSELPPQRWASRACTLGHGEVVGSSGMCASAGLVADLQHESQWGDRRETSGGTITLRQTGETMKSSYRECMTALAIQ